MDDENKHTEALIRPFLDEEKRVKSMPRKYEKRFQVLTYLAEQFPLNFAFTEKEVNTLLNRITLLNDPCLLRRELVDAGFLTRARNGSVYVRSGDPL